MGAHLLSQAAHLSDHELLERMKLLAHREREVTVVLVAHLAVLDERRLYLAEGCSSLFTYCTQVLHLSEHGAYNRIEAARAARKFPVILGRLADGTLNLTTVRLLAPHVTAENHEALLDEARHKSKRQVEELVARLRPQSPVPSTIRRLPMLAHRAPTAPTAEEDARAGDGEAEGLQASSVVLPLSAAPASSETPVSLSPSRRAVVEPLAPQQYRVQFTADAETHEKLRLAQDLLRHQVPDGDVGKVIDLALTALLKDLAKQKHAATDRPRRAEPLGKSVSGHDARLAGEGAIVRGEQRSVPARSRHIPAEVKRAVWERDGGQCAFVAPDGRRCTERGFLEFHHLVPYAAGGGATADNIELRCRAHNGYEAEGYFGRQRVLQYRTELVPERVVPRTHG